MRLHNIVFKRSSKKENISSIIYTCIFSIILIIGAYLYFDSSISMDYVLVQSPSVFNADYKVNFTNLIEKIEDGDKTGINSYDDSNVTPGDTLDIDLNNPIFANFRAGTYINHHKGCIGGVMYTTRDAKTYVRAHTFINSSGIGGSKLANAAILSFPKFWENCTVRKDSGIVMLYDRYIPIGIGQFFNDYFGFPTSARGLTYRVELESGVTFDTIVVDLKKNDDMVDEVKPHKVLTSVVDGTGKGLSIGHRSSDPSLHHHITVIEPYNLNTKSSTFPKFKWGSYTVDYSVAKFVDDTESEWADGEITSINLNDFIPIKGEIKSITYIEDQRVIELMDEAGARAKELGMEDHVSSSFLGR